MTETNELAEAAARAVSLVPQSAEIGELAAALAKAQGEMRHAAKSSDNPFFRSKYADLAEVWDAVREPLSKNNLCVVQTTDVAEDGKIVVVTTLMHSSGQWIRGRLAMTAVRQAKDRGYELANDPQAIGSCITYARRYGLAAITGLAQDDDDLAQDDDDLAQYDDDLA